MPRQAWNLAVALAVLAGALAAPAVGALAQEPQEPREAPTSLAPLVERGIAVYREQGCGACHALGAAGTTGMFAPPHDAMAVIAAARIADPSYRSGAVDVAGYVRESIVSPTAYVVPGYAGSYHKMPPYTSLSERDLDALVALLAGPPAEGGE